MTRWSAHALARALEQFPPTDEQRQVIEAPLDPMLVIAGAGSGKTETMAAKVVYLVANGLVEPGEILGLTFTRKAAAELSDRIRERLRTIADLDDSIDLTTPPRIATYNSYAAGIVADHGLRAGIDPDSVLISEAGRHQLAEHIVTTWSGDLDTGLSVFTVTNAVAALAGEMSEHGLTSTQVREHLNRTIAEITSKGETPRSKQPRAEIRRYLARMDARVQLMDLVDAFTEGKRARGVVDFGDQVRLAADLAATVPAVGSLERGTYKVVLLDEYQDTSIAQVQLLAALFGSGHPVTAVGDPNQAIYGWRGAAAGTLLKFPEKFRSEAGPARVATLSTAWRNSRDILTVANKVAAPLRGEAEVPELSAREGADAGRVEVFYGQTIDEEAARIVTHLNRLGWPGENTPTTAVLVRARKTFAPIAHALKDAGIPHQISGLGGLLTTPEVADLWATLTVVHDPSRAEVLMRLLTGPRMRIGPRDLAVLDAWAVELARDRTTGPTPGEEPQPHQAGEDAEAASVVEALQHLPPEHYRPRAVGHALSDEARTRLGRLARSLRTIRSLTHLPLVDLVASAEQTLGLDIDVLAHRRGADPRENLDAFAAVAASFTSGVDEANLGGFLAWLDAASEHERGLEAGEVEPDPGAVQLMTIHAAKGLEWDAVVVAGMGEGLFPSIRANSEGVRMAGGWLGAVDLLPYELRGDSDNLPSFDYEAATTHADMKDVDETFRRQEGARALQEERRLAYVAMTRAKSDLLLTGSFWVPGRATPYDPSVFLTETTRAGIDLPDVPGAPEMSDNPLTEDPEPVAWPPHGEGQPVPEVEPALTHPGEDDDPDIARWYHLARLLLAERDSREEAPSLALEHLSASRVVAAARDPHAFSKNLRRPVPAEPSDRARQGTQFHSWVEQHFNAPALVDWQLLPGADDDSDVGDLEALQETFLSSPWADAEPVALEADVETTIAGVRIRSRIDAVFATPEGGYHVVDWKTGRAPRGESEQHVRMVQLLLYRLAWARARNVPVDDVQASFYYVPEDLTVPAPDLGEEQIIEQITDHLKELGEIQAEDPLTPRGGGSPRSAGRPR